MTLTDGHKNTSMRAVGPATYESADVVRVAHVARPWVTVQLLGRTKVVVDGQERTGLGVKPRQILEILAVHVGQPVPKDRLADLLWDGRPPRSCVGSLESYVCNLRRALQLGQGRRSVLRTTNGGYVMDAALVSVDVAQVRGLVHDLRADKTRETSQRVRAAVRLVQGRLLASEPTLLWADEERAVFGRQLAGACLEGAAAAMDIGEADTGLSLYDRVLEHNEYLEAAWIGRMQALGDLGRRVEALRTYAQLRRTFRRELGIAPSREAHRVYLSLMQVEKQPSVKLGMDRAELSTLLTLLQDALIPMSGILAPDKLKALSDLAADVLRSTSLNSVAGPQVAVA
jgi:DNA-binding SARP family transcriptional activator